MNTPNPKLDDVLEKLGCIECRSFPNDEYIDEAKQIILSDLLAMLPEKKSPDTTKDDWANTELQQVKGYNTAIEEAQAAIQAYVGVES